MRRALVITLALSAAAGLIWMFAQAPGAGARPLASLFPSGPALYLEARDFQALLKDWNGSQEKRLWLASDNYQVFSRSNLFQKLQNAQTEFAAAAGIPPNQALLQDVAGSQSAIAIYDIGKLQFLFITRIPSARVSANAIWKLRGSYEPRKSSGLDYYFKYDKTTDRTAVFANTGDYLLLATREDVLAAALALIAGQNLPAVAGETWYGRSVQAAKSAGELRLVLNMPKLLESPYMRSYWIQRNASELRQYEAAISDIARGSGEFREDRSLFRVHEETPSRNEAAVAAIQKFAPSSAGFYRATSSPTPQQALDLIRLKILQPQPGLGPESQIAPEAGSLDATLGTEADLETRIDEPPLEITSPAIPVELQKLLEADRLDAMLQIGSTRASPDGVFVGIDSAVVLLGHSNWNLNSVRAAMTAAGALLSGPAPIAISAQGPILVVASRPEFLQTILSESAKSQAFLPARYVAFYQHTRELPDFEKMTRLIDNPLRGEGPMFFSQNVASLGRTLGRLTSATILVHDTGAVVSQNLTYHMKP